ncbi:TolC family outer membrane protein [Geminicoccus harenae]|uniref:TolC family outer membrane protein n=1 Tax=Geminicoccus harenae TaxID=2498453 RepID=UPI00168B3F1F|nr:TolC family outer membrane protein [Geminicoccus harenae]
MNERRLFPNPLLLSLLLGLYLGTGSASAQQTLDAALVEAYLSNPDLAAERAALRATDSRVAQARAGYYPSLTATLQGQLTRGKQTSAFEFPTAPGFDFTQYEELLETQDADATFATLALKQNLWAGGETQARLEGAERRVRAGQANLLSVEQNVLLNAATAYVATWRDRLLIGEAQANLDRLTRQLAATERRFELGEVAQTDLIQARSRLARASADRDQARADLARSEATFEQVIGPPPERLTDPAPIADLPDDLDTAYTLAELNPDIRRAALDVDAARADTDAAFAGLLPSIDLVGQLNYANDPNPTFYDQQSAQVGVTLTVPLFQGGAAAAQVRETRHTVRQLENQRLAVGHQIRRDIRTYWTAVDAASSAVGAYEMEAEANALALRGVERESNLGLRTVLDVLDAQYDLFRSRSNLVRARASAVTASFQLKAALGQLTVSSLALPVQPYDPEINYEIERVRLFGLGGD